MNDRRTGQRWQALGLIWAAVHVYFLIGNRHRLLVALQGAWSYVTFGRGARLIVGSDDSAKQTP